MAIVLNNCISICQFSAENESGILTNIKNKMTSALPFHNCKDKFSKPPAIVSGEDSYFQRCNPAESRKPMK